MKNSLLNNKIFFVYKKYKKGGYYINNAKKALNKLGLKIRIVENLSLFEIIFSKKGTIFHIHFPEEMYNSNSQLWRLIRAFWTMLQLLIIKIKGSVIVWTLHDTVPHEPFNTSKIDIFIRKILSRFARLVFIHSIYSGRELHRYYNKKVNSILVPHGNYINFWGNSKISRTFARNKLGVKKGAFVYLFFGRIRQYKGVDNLIKAFKKMEEPNLNLIIAGVPAGSNWDIKQNKKNILDFISNDERILPHLKWIEKRDVSTYFNAADVVVLPFERITNSGSLITAISFGKPFVIPNKKTLLELVNKNGGIIYDPKNSNGLEKAIKKIRRKNLGRMSKENYRIAIAMSWKKFAEKTIEGYKSINKV
ncbi:MAG: glycosyltransferase [Candidatus Micrarchaeota archaeon]|nr:glycosyltransferase [Candidatus Micrarchaeota archaeon]